MSERESGEYKKDYLFIGASFVLWFVVAPVMFIAGIWADYRWFMTGVLALFVGALCAILSAGLDKLYARERRPK